MSDLLWNLEVVLTRLEFNLACASLGIEGSEREKVRQWLTRTIYKLPPDHPELDIHRTLLTGYPIARGPQ